MSKARRMLKKKQQKKERQAVRQNLGAGESAFEKLFEEGKYEETLQALAKLIGAGDRNPALFYQAAYSYYMLGDNDRAAEWINNTLTFAPAHVQARVLLARICFAENRAADGFKIFEFLLSSEKAALGEEDFDAIRQSMAYYLRHDRETVKKYPSLCAFLGLEEGEAAEKAAQPQEGASDALAKLQALKNRLQGINASREQADAAEPVKTDADPATERTDSTDAGTQDGPAVSVIIPVYRAEKYLRGCLDSVANQTFADYEVILIDDAGEDGSLAIEEEYAKRENWRLYCMAENAGPGPARNAGLRHARGKYIAFVDADDLLEPDFLAVLVNAAEQERADVVCAGYRQWEEDRGGGRSGEKTVTLTPERTALPGEPEKRIQMLLNGRESDATKLPDPVPWGRIIRRDFLASHAIAFPPLPRFEDTIFNLPLLLEAGKIVLLPDVLYGHRLQPDSITHQSNEQHAVYLQSILQGFDRLEDYAAAHPHVAENEALRTALGVYLMNHMTIGLLCRYPLEQAKPIVDHFARQNFKDHAPFVSLLLLRYLSELKDRP